MWYSICAGGRLTKNIPTVGLFQRMGGAFVPWLLTSMRLVSLMSAFWLTLEGAEAGKDDESQRKKENLKGARGHMGVGNSRGGGQHQHCQHSYQGLGNRAR